MSIRMSIHDWDIEVVSDLVRFGKDPEEGTDIVGLVWRIQVTGPDGDRLVLDHRIPSLEWRQSCGEFGGGWVMREGARGRADRLAAMIRREGVIDMALWQQGRPVYGSAAWTPEVELEELQREMMEDLR